MGKFQLGVQTKNVVKDANPEEGFTMLAQAGFSCADFVNRGGRIPAPIHSFKN